MGQIIDGFIFQYDGRFYNLFPESHSGAIIAEVEPCDILYVFYDEDAAENAKQDAIERRSEWYDEGLDPDELTDIIADLEVVPLLDALDDVVRMSLVVEAAYLC